MGPKTNELFRKGTLNAWQWAEPATFIRWFTDGERRYGIELWKLATVSFKCKDAPPHYGYRKVWRQGLEVAMNIKGSQGQKQVEWVKVEHPFTAMSPIQDVHANHNDCRFEDFGEQKRVKSCPA